MSKKIALCFGISGQDGSYLAELLLDKGYEVHGVIRRSSSINTGRIDHIFDRLNLHYGDITDSLNVFTLITKIKPDKIFNLAAQSHVGISFDTAHYTSMVDAIGTLNVLESVRQGNHAIRVYQASTSELYGGIARNMPDTGYTEESVMCPQSPYAVAKLYSYHLCRLYRHSYGMFVSNGILFNHTSPRRGHNFVEKKIVDWVKNYIKDKNIKPLQLGNLYSYRDIGHSKDYVNAMDMILDHSHPDDFVVATGKTHTIKKIVELCFKEFGLDLCWQDVGSNEKGYCNGKKVVEINPKYYRPSEVNVLLGNSSKIRHELGWMPYYDLVDIIHEMVEN